MPDINMKAVSRMVEMPLFEPVHFQECHSRVIHASAGACLDAVEAFTVEQDPLIRFCLGVRDLPGRMILGQAAHRFSMKSFVFLGRIGDVSLAYGLAGSFWRWDYGLDQQAAQGASFWAGDGPSCRLLLTFETDFISDDQIRLLTRTRISCPDSAMRSRMAAYWMAIRPVSGLIRRRLLARVAHYATKQGAY
ncbi:hypothetical protein GCM10007207_09090 [Asaia siamensis]|uniref:DUF1990 domain-containing protein n=2 Tax=Asaia siamensis TaxID=110479 RepID=A0ABQ1LKU4_9PROT|nr:hypothetical protein AA0323_1041 [Asaia siamensis NRIC 0323]GGC25906.1 hypothetical protein GCM10007207_09090 [Asaia siamensis]